MMKRSSFFLRLRSCVLSASPHPSACIAPSMPVTHLANFFYSIVSKSRCRLYDPVSHQLLSKLTDGHAHRFLFSLIIRCLSCASCTCCAQLWSLPQVDWCQWFCISQRYQESLSPKSPRKPSRQKSWWSCGTGKVPSDTRVLRGFD